MFPEELFHKTFINHLFFSAKHRGKSAIACLLKNYAKYRFNSGGHGGYADIYEYRTMWYLTNVGIHMTVNIHFLLIGAVFSLYLGLFRGDVPVIIDCFKNDRQHEHEIKFIDKGTTPMIKNDASVIRATILQHRSVLGIVNPREKL